MSRPHPAHLPIAVPDGATDVVASGPRPFVTRVEHTAADGVRHRWQARAHRKAQPTAGAGRRRLSWWIVLLFAVGSTCFRVGPVPADASAVGGGPRR